MAVDCFLKMDGIQGESTDATHRDEIKVLSWSWGETLATAPAGAGGGAGKVSMQDFRFSKAVDKASPKLILACASGQKIKDAVLTCRKADGSKENFLTITLTEVTVSSYEIADGATGDPTDQFVLHFTKIQFNYVQQKADGTRGASTEAGWDVKNNKAA